jgi:hypothetical protein
MSDAKPLTFTEIVIRPCELTYGTAPCGAALGVTGTKKCYNSPRTCQVPEDYSAAEQVLRFAIPTEDLDASQYEFIPNMQSVDVRAQVLKPGESMGERESVSATYGDHLHNDVGYDKYVNDRGFNTYESGTHWGKFSARWPNLQGYEFRIVRGFVGQAIEDMERSYYVIDSTNGPGNSGQFGITAKDALKFLDDDRAVCPRPSTGQLVSGITDAVSEVFTLTPSGIGDDEYAASGLASIGDENVTFTRTGDTVTLTGRGLKGSQASDHDGGETFQSSEVFTGADPADIIYRLLSEFTDTDPIYFDLSAWLSETTTHIGRLYSADIMKPVGVKILINELINQVGLCIGTDVINKKIFVKALRQLTPVLSVDDNYILEGTISSKQQDSARVSFIITSYGQINPLLKIDEVQNYRAALASAATDERYLLENLPLAIRKIYSRWITVFNRPAAEFINDAILARYTNAPRQVSFRLPPQIAPQIASAMTVSSRIFQNDEGLQDSVTGQVVSLEKDDTGYNVMLQELKYMQQAATDRNIFIDQESYNINLRSVHDLIYTLAESGDVVNVYIENDAFVGSVSTDQFSFVVGDWVSGVEINIYCNGAGIQIGGAGGNGRVAQTGLNGGPSFYTRYPVNIHDAKIGGGGGGGGGVVFSAGYGVTTLSGSGGSGYISGVSSGPTSAYGGSGGIGGGFGLAGSSGSAYVGLIQAYSGGAAGVAIDGVSYITFIGATDICGAQIN